MSEPTPAPAPVNLTRLVHEAATASSVLWIEPGDGSSHPAWFVWDAAGDPLGTGPAAYVISGPGEQPLPELPPQVMLVLRSKDSGGRLLRILADVTRVRPEDSAWAGAAQQLRTARLNATPDVDDRWRESGVIWVLAPHGRPAESPGTYAAESRAVDVTPGAAATAGWRPWHLGGRRRR